MAKEDYNNILGNLKKNLNTPASEYRCKLKKKRRNVPHKCV